MVRGNDYPNFLKYNLLEGAFFLATKKEFIRSSEKLTV